MLFEYKLSPSNSVYGLRCCEFHITGLVALQQAAVNQS